ncbi:MAG: sugar porter family MFS transporter [Planctomycetes bacterium]|nr:sugar porter family MFS transporter [Planctomycetota bacterium]
MSKSAATDELLTPPPIPGMGAIVLAVSAAALAGLLFGYDTGVASGIQGYLQTCFHLTNAQLGFAIASLDLGCIGGAILAGPLADRFGRKHILIVCAILFAVSGILSAIPQNLTELVLARILGGLAVGASSMIAPVYIAEISPEKHRGRFGSLFQLGIVIGIAVVYWVNYLILNAGHQINAAHHLTGMDWNQTTGWRWMLGSETLPAIIFLAMLLTIRESPRWLVINNRESEARAILTRLFGAQRAEHEIAAVKEVAHQEEGRLRELFTKTFRLPLLIALFLAVFSQFSGINSIIYYAPRVLGAAGMNTSSAFGSTALIGMVLVLFTFIAVAYVDRAGRKLLLCIGTAIQVLALASVGLVFAIAAKAPAIKIHNSLKFQGVLSNAKFAALAKAAHSAITLAPHFTAFEIGILLVSILIFIAAFSMALGPIPWIIISEIFPARIRGRAASVGILTLWAAIFVVAQTFPILKNSIGLTATYFIYAGCSLITFLFAVFILPETKGRTLEEIELSWHKRS